MIEELVKLTDPFWTERLVEVIDVPEAVVNTNEPSIVVVAKIVSVVMVIAPLTNRINGVPVTDRELE